MFCDIAAHGSLESGYTGLLVEGSGLGLETCLGAEIRMRVLCSAHGAKFFC